MNRTRCIAALVYTKIVVTILEATSCEAMNSHTVTHTTNSSTCMHIGRKQTDTHAHIDRHIQTHRAQQTHTRSHTERTNGRYNRLSDVCVHEFCIWMAEHRHSVCCLWCACENVQCLILALFSSRARYLLHSLFLVVDSNETRFNFSMCLENGFSRSVEMPKF